MGNKLGNVTVLPTAKPALQNSEFQFRHLLDKLPAGGYTCDRHGLITYFNDHAVKLWGRAPKLNDSADRFCGSFKLFARDGSSIAHEGVANGSIRQESSKQDQEGYGGAQATHPEKRQVGKEGNKPQTGHRDRAFGSPEGRCQSPAAKIFIQAGLVWAACPHWQRRPRCRLGCQYDANTAGVWSTACAGREKRFAGSGAPYE